MKKMSSWIDIVKRECSWIGLYYDILQKVINEKGYTRVLEIGNGYGLHLKEMLANCPNCSFIGVDPYRANYDPNDFFGTDVHRIMGGRDIQHSFDLLRERIELMLSPYGNRIQLVRQNSWDYAPYIEDGSLDLVFVDGDHTYDAVKRDIELYWPKVRSGGYLTGDDFAIPAVTRAVTEFASRNHLRIERMYNNKGVAQHWAFYKTS